MSKQLPPATTASAVGPCPTLIQICRMPRHWRFTGPHHHTTLCPCVPVMIRSGDYRNNFGLQLETNTLHLNRLVAFETLTLFEEGIIVSEAYYLN